MTVPENGDGADIRYFKQLEVRYMGSSLKGIAETV